jgi:hypothetical protein
VAEAPLAVPVNAMHSLLLLQLPYFAQLIPVGGVPETIATLSPAT